MDSDENLINQCLALSVKRAIADEGNKRNEKRTPDVFRQLGANDSRGILATCPRPNVVAQQFWRWPGLPGLFCLHRGLLVSDDERRFKKKKIWDHGIHKCCDHCEGIVVLHRGRLARQTLFEAFLSPLIYTVKESSE